MIRVMVFIDGTWIRLNVPKMAREEGLNPRTYRMHYGKLLDRLKDRLASSKELRLEPHDIDIVRPYIFGHVPVNVDDRDRAEATSSQAFYDLIGREFGYDVDLSEVNFRGRRLNFRDRQEENPDDDWTPKEKRVDVALASAMLYYAAIPYAYDIAIAVIGDEDYVPVLQRVRSLGRRVAIASVRTRVSSPCSRVYSDEYDEEGVRDFDVIWLNELAKDLEVPERIIECQDPEHTGRRQAVTSRLPIADRPEVCDDCFDRQRVEKRETRAAVINNLRQLEKRGWSGRGGLACGAFTGHKSSATGPYGFIKATIGEHTNDYYFKPRDLTTDLEWDDLSSSELLVFRPEFTPPDRFFANEIRRPLDSDWED